VPRVPLDLGTSVRSKPLKRTLDAALPAAGRAGVSRVTDITRLDRLGLPVFASVRPRGRVLRVHAGKALDSLGARVGALMEAIEFWSAEPQNSVWIARSMPVAEIVEQFEARLGLVDFAPRVGRRIRPSQTLPTIECEDLLQDSVASLPAELIFLPFEANPPEDLFGWTSNGLASGNSVAEATLHALFEVLERDALSMNLARNDFYRLDDDDLPEPFRTLAGAWRCTGVQLAVGYVPNELMLSCFEACLHESGGERINLATGSGLHSSRTIALTRAICEAAQSRLSHIHGGREDVTLFYSKYRSIDPARRQAETDFLRKMLDARCRCRFADLPDEPCTVEIPALLDRLLGRLRRAGFPSVFRYRFASGLAGIHVVKVIVPRCEDIVHRPRCIGPRLFARICGRA
jgi:ribosomal protein S12 methylthiotransferase accessory factor